MPTVADHRKSLPVSIYSSGRCGWAIRNYAALLEKGQGFLLTPSKTRSGEKRPEFLALSPVHRTPVLKHDDVVVWDSMCINAYIDEAFEGPSLMPDDAGKRARVRNMMHHCDDVLMPLVSRLIQKSGSTKESSELVELLSNLERFVFDRGANGRYACGAQFTLMDISYLNFFDNLSYINQALDQKLVTLSPRISDWKSAINERPSVIRARQIARAFEAREEDTLISA